jgi:Diaminopimelate decarboxylase
VDVWPYSWPRPVVRRERVTLTGQLSTSRDILVRDVRAPGLRAGDRVVFSLAGCLHLVRAPPGVRQVSRARLHS